MPFLFGPTLPSDKLAHLLWSQMLALKCVIEGLWLSYISPLMLLPCSELSSAMAECEVQGLIYLSTRTAMSWYGNLVLSFSILIFKVLKPFLCLCVSSPALSAPHLYFISWLPPVYLSSWLLLLTGTFNFNEDHLFAVSMLPVTAFGFFSCQICHGACGALGCLEKRSNMASVFCC